MNRWARFTSWSQRSRFLHHTPPDQLAAGSSAGQADPPADAGKIDGPLTWDNIDTSNPAITAMAFKQLQAESRDHRLKYRGEKEKNAELQAKLKSFEEKEAAQAIANAEAEKNYKEALALREQQTAQERLIAQQTAVESKLEAAFLKKGFEPKFMKLLDKSGISIDATGAIRGVEEAIERMEHEFGDVITKAAPPAQGQPGQQQQAAAPPNVADMMQIPGSNQTYGQYKDSLNPGRAPAGGNPPPAPQPPDFKKMTKQEEQAWWARYKTSLGKK